MHERNFRLIAVFLIVAADIANSIAFFVVSNGHYVAPLLLGVVCICAAISSAICYVLNQKGIKNSFYKAVIAAAIILNLPVVFYSIAWLLTLAGVEWFPAQQ